jgi:hypothetical protein
MKGSGLIVVALLLVIAAVAVIAVAQVGPAGMIANLLIWVFNALGAILEGFIDAFAPFRK